jgi:hypothetical protein
VNAFGSLSSRPVRVLDFDIENRPLHYWYGDATTAEITAIAWAWYGDTYASVDVLKAPPLGEASARLMLGEFKEAYDAADMVTGHFIRGHDLPVINAALIELGMPTLGAKLTSDTKLDMVKRGKMSVSQKNLAQMLGVEAPKVDMPQSNWRDANRLTPEGIELTKARVIGDIRQHMALRIKMLERGLLGPPKVWVPGASTKDVTYIP